MPQVQQGQSVSSIAAANGMTIPQFLALNPSFAANSNNGTQGDYQGAEGQIQIGQNYILASTTPPTGGNTGTGSGTGTPPNTNTPVGEVFTPVDVGIENPDPFFNTYGSSLEGAANANIDENSIRSNVLSRFQDQINATNAIYDQELAKARRKGLQDIGSGTAILARRGLAGSARGMGIESNITQNNLEIENAIAAQRAAALAAIMSQANTNATAELQRQREAKEKGSAAYLDFLKTKEERVNGAINGVAASLLKQGIKDIKEIDPLKLNEILANLQKAYGATNITVDKIRNAFGEAKTKQDAATAASDLEKTKLEIEKAKLNPAFNLSQGQQRYAYNSKTGKYELVASVAPKATGKAGDGTIGAINSALVNQAGYNKLGTKQKTQADSINNLVTSLKAYKTALNAGGSGGGINLFGTDSALLQTKLNSIIFAAAQAEGTGALQQADREVIEKIIPNITSLGGAFNSLTKGGLVGVNAKVDDQINKYISNLAGYGLTPTGDVSNIVNNTPGITPDGTALDPSSNNLEQPETMTLNGQTLYLQPDGTYE